MQARQRSPRGFYSSEYRHRDGGGGVPARWRRGDVFLEAGRLAAEYLVSQGLLQPNSLLPLKWRNHKTAAAGGGRQSALARLGRRKRGSFSRSNGMDWVREYRRDVNNDDDDHDHDEVGFSVRHKDEEDLQQQQSGGGGVDHAVVKSNLQSGGVSDVDVEVGVGNDSESVSVRVKDGGGESERLSNVAAQENSTSGGVVADLVSLCNNSVKVPTRTRSSITRKNLKAGNSGDGTEGAQSEELLPENQSLKGSSSVDLEGQKSYDIVHVDADVAEVEPAHAVEEVQELDAVCKAAEILSVGCQSSQSRDFMQDNNQESSATLPESGGCSSLAEERSEKCGAEDDDDDDDLRDDHKKLREWLPSLVPKTGGCFLQNNPIEVKESAGKDEISHSDKVAMTSDQGSLMSSGSQVTEGGDRLFLQCSKEKPPMPSSFRTCDLNLIEASEVHENHVDHPVLFYPPAVSETKKALPIDEDLTMSHASVSGNFNTHATNGKEIEVLDLENDSIQEEKAIDNIDRKTETMFSGLEGFTSHAQNAVDMHDVQDGYGLMISELLGTDFTNCSSVPGDINSVHNEMGLHSGSGTLAEDDPIYMSLGELSYFRPWEQPPTQDYQKHF